MIEDLLSLASALQPRIGYIDPYFLIISCELKLEDSLESEHFDDLPLRPTGRL